MTTYRITRLMPGAWAIVNTLTDFALFCGSYDDCLTMWRLARSGAPALELAQVA